MSLLQPCAWSTRTLEITSRRLALGCLLTNDKYCTLIQSTLSPRRGDQDSRTVIVSTNPLTILQIIKFCAYKVTNYSQSRSTSGSNLPQIPRHQFRFQLPPQKGCVLRPPFSLLCQTRWNLQSQLRSCIAPLCTLGWWSRLPSS